MDLGKKIRAHRDELGLTQAELADKLGLTYSSVSQWESGRATPRTPILRQLADLFDTTVADLMGEDASEAAISGTSRMVPLLGFAHMGEPCDEGDGTVLASADICRQMRQSGTEPVGALKTAKSARTVVILPQAADRLVEIAAARAAEGREWMCDRGDGLPMNRSICNDRWRKLCAARGIEHIPCTETVCRSSLLMLTIRQNSLTVPQHADRT